MRLLLLTALLAMATLTQSAPLADETAAVAKRSSEVIFYENQRNGVDVKKRSEDWQDKEQPLSQQEPGTADRDRQVLVDEEALDELEQQTFYDALDFILEKLVSQSYGPEGAANRVNEPLYGTSTVFMPTMPTELPATDAVNQVKHSDAEADALKMLMQQQASLSKSADVAVPSSDIGVQKDSASVEPSADDTESKLHEDVDVSAEVPAADGGKETADDDADEEDNLDEVETYLEYLNLLKLAEDKLEMELDAYRQLEKDLEHTELEKLRVASPKPAREIRRKRSLNSNLEVWGGMGSEQEEDDTICFSRAEVLELKNLLLELTKDRLKSEDMIEYLLDKNPEEADYNEPGYGASRYDETPVDNRLGLKELASKMNRMDEDKRGAEIYYNQWPYYKK